MRRTILLALVAALTLALGFNAVASAGPGVGADAQATAKKKAAKKKCAKPKAKKKKAGKSLADASAKKKKAAKKKCAKPKAKKKATPKPGPKGPAAPTTFGDGTFEDAASSVTITVTNGGQQAQVGFVSGTCLGHALVNVSGPLTQSGSVVKASGTQKVLGGFGSINWTLSVTPSNLSYQLDAESTLSMPDEDPCTSSTNNKGTLVKK